MRYHHASSEDDPLIHVSILDRMPFGKHRGILVGTVIEEEPTYIRWAINNTQLRLDDEALAYLQECSE